MTTEGELSKAGPQEDARDGGSDLSRREFITKSAAVGASFALIGGLGARGALASSGRLAAGREPAAQKPKYGGTISCSESGAPSGYDIKWWNDPIDYPHASIFEQLVEQDPYTGKFTPVLATALPTSSKGGTLYTYHLRQGVQFHRGFGEMTSEDVKWSWERLMSPELNSNAASLFTVIKFVGLSDFLSKKASHIAGLRAVDPYTFEFELEEPDSQAVPILTYYPASIFSKKGFEQMGAKQWNWTPVATGPFELTNVNPATGATLVKNAKYWQPKLPYVDSVDITYNVDPQLALLRIEKNQQDMMFDDVPASSINQVLHDPSYKGRVFKGTSGDPTFLSLPTKIKPFGDVRVRKAVAMAIDKQKMARILEGSAVATGGGFLPPNTPWYQPHVSYELDRTEAKKLLAEAGLSRGFKAELMVYNYSPWIDMAESVQGDLAQIGITVTLKSLPPGEFDTETNTLKDKLPMIIWDWGVAGGSPSTVFDSAFTSAALKEGCCNYPRFSEPSLDALIAKAHKVSFAESVEVYKQAETVVVRDLALWVPLVYLGDTQIVSSRIRGYRIANYIGGTRKIFQDYWIA